ncbi:MAG: TonB-dependent SusC/RagA subfamily outer membrane receptor [Cyclobacteriaceae bacterium]|jgi:TonB-dependent SusC/RagA subfamily outer membrane receptor
MNLNIPRAISLFFFLMCTYLSEDVVAQKITKAFEEYRSDFSGEKIYIHLDKSVYHYSDNIWFKVYLVDGLSNIANAISNVVYVDLIDQSGKLIISKKVKIENGGGNGDFKLSKDFIEGTYEVRGYTNFMRNFGDEFFFKQRVVILNGHSLSQNEDKSSNVVSGKNAKPNSRKENIGTPFHLDFFPEGGNMIEGITNAVGFKATDLLGKGIDVRGEVIAEKGEVVATFESLKFGIGSFFFRPAQGEVYKVIARMDNAEWVFDLPKPEPTGIMMRVNQSTKGVIKVSLKTNVLGNLEDCTLIGQMRGELILARENIKSYKDGAIIVFSSKDFPVGILQLTLFGKNNEPQCERLVFVKNESQSSSLSITTDKTAYQKRDKVELFVDMKGMAFGLNSSVGVTNSSVLGTDSEYSDNMLSYLILSSDLKGVIENPGYYFSENVDLVERRRALDNVMITHGWRRFSWKTVLNKGLKKPIIEAQKGFNISGKVVTTNKKQELVTSGNVSLAVSSVNGFTIDQTDIDEHGIFLFSRLNIPDSARLLLTALGGKTKKGGNNNVKLNNKVRILLDQEEGLKTQEQVPRAFFKAPINDLDTTYFKTLDQISVAYDFKNSILLEELTIKGRSQEKNDPFFDNSKMYRKPSHRVVFDSIPGYQAANSIFDLLKGRVPGLNVVGSGIDQNILIRGISSLSLSSNPLYLLDGMPVEASIVFALFPANVAYIDILKGASAAIYGAGGANGVIAIYTRGVNGFKEVENFELEDRGRLNYTFNGYNKAREFHVPRYDIDKPEYIKPDYRSTLYWNPNVELNEAGQGQFTFSTSDDIDSTFKIELEGITSDGQPIRVVKYFYTGQNQ